MENYILRYTFSYFAFKVCSKKFFAVKLPQQLKWFQTTGVGAHFYMAPMALLSCDYVGRVYFHL